MRLRFAVFGMLVILFAFLPQGFAAAQVSSEGFDDPDVYPPKTNPEYFMGIRAGAPTAGPDVFYPFHLWLNENDQLCKTFDGSNWDFKNQKFRKDNGVSFPEWKRAYNVAGPDGKDGEPIETYYAMIEAINGHEPFLALSQFYSSVQTFQYVYLYSLNLESFEKKKWFIGNRIPNLFAEIFDEIYTNESIQSMEHKAISFKKTPNSNKSFDASFALKSISRLLKNASH
ncbi:MAG: hypothetical protein HZA67_10485 [Rhodospirillales bacterium]|nr:hypothetical protein [Rhodospirillales bacterium]